MSVLVRFTDPKGQRFYGVNPFDHHALYGTREQAESHETPARAQGWINRACHGVGAFWQSERDQAERTRRQLRGWKIEIVPEVTA